MLYGTVQPLTAEEIPTAIKLFNVGVNDAHDGAVIYDPAMADDIMAASKSTDKLPVDIAHLSHQPGASSDDHKASAWFDLKADETGIWAENLQWTQKALDYLHNREFRFFSPAFFVDEEQRITRIVDFALTNTPSLKDLTPLVHTEQIEKLKGNNMSEDKLIKLTEENKDLLKTNKELVAQIKKYEEVSDLDQKENMIADLQSAKEELSRQVIELTEQVQAYEEAIAQQEKENILAQLSLADEEVKFLTENMTKDKIVKYVEFQLAKTPAASKQDEAQLKSEAPRPSKSAEEIKQFVAANWKNHPLNTASRK